MTDFSWGQFAATAGIAVVSYWVGAKNARYTFDLNRDAGERQAAAALKADLERIRATLGDRAEKFGSIVYGMTSEPPEFHRWSEPLVTRLASADPKIVSGAMELERELHNFKIRAKAYNEIHAERSKAEADVKHLRGHPYPESYGENFHNAHAVELLNAEGRVDQLRDARDDALRLMKTHHQSARTQLGALISRLDHVINRKPPEFLELPEERANPVTLRDK